MLPPTGVTSRCDRCDSPSPRLPGARGEPKSALHVEPQHPPDTLHRYPPRWPPPVQRAAGPRWTAHTLAGSGLTRRSQAPCARPPSCLGRHSSNSLLPHHWWPAAAAYNLAPPVTPVTPVVTPVHRWPRWCLTHRPRHNQASRCGSPSAPSLPQTLSRIVVSFRRPTSERARSR